MVLALMMAGGYGYLYSHGLSGKYANTDPKEGQIKVACVGDSITYGHGVENWKHTTALTAGGKNKSSFCVSKTGTEHIYNCNPGVNRKGNTLQQNAQCSDFPHLKILAGKQDDDRICKNNQHNCHYNSPNKGCNGCEAEASHDTFISFGAPVVTGNRLKTTSKTKDNTEREHHDLIAYTDSGENCIRDIAGKII